VVHTCTPQANRHVCTSIISYFGQSTDYPRVLPIDNHSSSTQTTRDKSTLCSHTCRPHPPTNATPLNHVLVMPVHKPRGVVPMTPPLNHHSMVIRAKAGFRMPPDSLVFTTTTPPTTPSLVLSLICSTLAGPHWNTTVEEEYAALMRNCTWELVPRPHGSNIMIDKWIFTHKFLSDGTIDYYKAHWIL
jgi:hypothetical protein